MSRVIACVAALALAIGLALLMGLASGDVEAKRKSKSTKELKGKAAVLVDKVGEAPGPRYAALGAFDTVNNAIMNYSGESNVYEGEKFKTFDWHRHWQVLDLEKDGTPKADAKWEERKLNPEPSVRTYGAVAQDYKNNLVYLFGGFAGGTNFLNDLWVYDLKSKKWTQLDKDIKDDAKPSVRDGHGFCFDPDTNCLYTWGGLQSLQPFTCLNDLWKFDLKKKTWSDITPKGDGPSARFALHLHCVGKDQAIMLGGYTNSGIPNDVWSVDLKSSKYKKLKNMPKTRCYTTSLYNPAISRVMVLAGCDGQKACDDVLLYDPTKDSWEDLGGCGHAASFGMSACNPETGETYLWGGTTGSFLAPNADTGLYRLTFGSESEIKKLKKEREKEAKKTKKSKKKER